MEKMYQSSSTEIHIYKAKGMNIFLHWIDAGVYASTNPDLPTITAQSVDDWALQLDALIEMIDEMFLPSFNGADYRKA